MTEPNQTVTLAGPCGSTAEITLFGAHVLSFRTSAGDECLFLSRKSPVIGPDPIRGGIPICWLVFGDPDAQGPWTGLPLHGFVRQQIWSAKIDAGNPAKAVFTLSSSESTKKIWNAEFELRYTVEIGQNTLKTTLAARNPEAAEAPLIFQIALHNYLKLPASVLPKEVELGESMCGVEYRDLLDGGQIKTDEGQNLVFSEETARVYRTAPPVTSLTYGEAGQSAIVQCIAGFEDVVIFQPGPARIVPDLHEGGWQEFVCYEPGRIENPVTLLPGEEWSACQRIIHYRPGQEPGIVS